MRDPTGVLVRRPRATRDLPPPAKPAPRVARRASSPHVVGRCGATECPVDAHKDARPFPDTHKICPPVPYKAKITCAGDMSGVRFHADAE